MSFENANHVADCHDKARLYGQESDFDMRSGMLDSFVMSRPQSRNGIIIVVAKISALVPTWILVSQINMGILTFTGVLLHLNDMVSIESDISTGNSNLEKQSKTSGKLPSRKCITLNFKKNVYTPKGIPSTSIDYSCEPQYDL